MRGDHIASVCDCYLLCTTAVVEGPRLDILPA